MHIEHKESDSGMVLIKKVELDINSQFSFSVLSDGVYRVAAIFGDLIDIKTDFRSKWYSISREDISRLLLSDIESFTVKYSTISSNEPITLPVDFDVKHAADNTGRYDPTRYQSPPKPSRGDAIEAALSHPQIIRR